MNQSDPGPDPGPAGTGPSSAGPSSTGPSSTNTEGGPAGGFDASRVRSVGEMRRSSDDRLIAGVCGGVARHLNIDPVIVRVVLAVLVLAGLAGLIVYVAAWLLLPADDAPRSPVADWFDLGSSEPQVRTTGLFVAGVLALLAIIGDSSWGLGAFWPLFWVLAWIAIPIVAVYWFVVVRPRRNRAGRASGPLPATSPEPAPSPAPSTQTAPVPYSGAPTRSPEADMSGTSTTPVPTAAPPLERAAEWPPGPGVPGGQAGPPPPRPTRPPRRPFSWALTVLTVSVAAIGGAVMYLVTTSEGSPRWTAYVALALGIVAAGLLVGTLVGNAGPLIAVGVLLAGLLGLGALLPSLSTGDVRWEPTSASQLRSDYTLGMGRMTIDLTDVQDPASLEGRTIRAVGGLGETVVVVPDDVAVALDASMSAGDVALFGRHWNGTGVDVQERSAATGPVLRLEMEHSMGSIKVVRG